MSSNPSKLVIATSTTTTSSRGDIDTNRTDGTGTMSTKLIGRKLQQEALLDAYNRCRSSLLSVGDNTASIANASDDQATTTSGEESSSLSFRPLLERKPLHHSQQQEKQEHQRREIVLVTGPSGSGKTALAKTTLMRQVAEECGYFCYGKCDQNQIVTQPYRPFVEAMNQLVDTILQSDDIEEDISRIVEAVEKATHDSDVSLLTDMFPCFRRILRGGDRDVHATLDGECMNQTQSSDFERGTQEHRQRGTNAASPSEDGTTPAIATYCKFLQEFCSTEQPLVLLLDDWQWIDPSSLQLIHSLFSSSNESATRMPGLMILGTCRTNEIGLHDPLSVLLRTLEEEHSVLITDIQVSGLSIDEVQQLIHRELLLLELPTQSCSGSDKEREAADPEMTVKDRDRDNNGIYLFNRENHEPSSSTKLSADKMASLSHVVLELTGGYPFHVLQSIRGLYDSKLLYHDGSKWEFDERDILNMKDRLKCESMLESKIRDLSNMSTYVHDTLIIGSILGSTFSSHHLYVATRSIITSQESTEFNTPSSSFSLPATSSPTSIFEQLQEALTLLAQNGVIVKLSNNSSPTIAVAGNRVNHDNSNPQHHCDHRSWFRWTHDRFQQEAYLMIPERFRIKYAVGIGRQLLYNLLPDEIAEDPFLITNLFLHDLNLISNPNERILIARLFNVAGMKAAKSSAFASAASFFQTGISLLPSPITYDGDMNTNYRWREQYKLSLALYNGALEMESCNGRYDVSDKLFEEVIHHTVILEDQIRAYNSKISSLSARHLDREAFELGLGVLRRLGESFPKQNPNKLQTVAAVLRTIWKIRRKSTDSILELRPMRLWNKLASLRIIQLIFPSGIRIGTDHVVLLTTRSIELTLQYGLSPIAEPVFSLFGMILGTIAVGFVDDAIRCGDIAAKICEKYSPKHRNEKSEWVCRSATVDYSYIQTWQTYWPSTLKGLASGMRPGLIIGDVELAYINSTFYNLSAIFCSHELLKHHIVVMDEHYYIFSNFHQSMYFLSLIRELARRLVGTSHKLVDDVNANPFSFREFCDQEIADDEAKAGGRIDPALLVISLSCQMFHSLYIGNLKHGKEVSEKILKLHFDTIYGPVIVVQIFFLIGMIDVVSARNTKKRKISRRRRAGLSSLKKLRACANKMKYPQNILNKIYLLEAERHVVRGDRDQALWKFQASSKFAKELGVIHEEALAYERAATALDEWGEASEAKVGMKKAIKLYKKWGSPVKVAQLETLPMMTQSDSQTLARKPCHIVSQQPHLQSCTDGNAGALNIQVTRSR